MQPGHDEQNDGTTTNTRIYSKQANEPYNKKHYISNVLAIHTIMY